MAVVSEKGSVPNYMTDRIAELKWTERCDRFQGERIQIGTSREGRAIYGYRFLRPAADLNHPATAARRCAGDAPESVIDVPGSVAGPTRSASDSDRSTLPHPPVVFLLSLVHPMEWIGREAHLALLDKLLEEPGPVEILSLPNANPDGTARVEESLRQGRPAWVRGNAAGVDLNRNFPVSFRRRSRLVDWWPMWRPGPAPASEPETQAVLEFLRGYQLQFSLSLHSFGRWLFYPPGATRSTNSDTAAHGRLMESVLEADNPLQYRSALLGTWSWWFRAYGIEIDTLRERHGGWTFLAELGRSSFGRWGLRELPQPFYVFNPRRPDLEIKGVLPLLHGLAQAALATEQNMGPVQ